MTTNKTRIAVFCSGGGSNFKSIYRSISEKPLNAEIVLCLSNRSQCGAMEFAREHGIATLHITEKQFDTFDEFAAAMVKRLKDAQIDIVLLAGYMRKVPDAVVRAFSGLDWHKAWVFHSRNFLDNRQDASRPGKGDSFIQRGSRVAWYGRGS